MGAANQAKKIELDKDQDKVNHIIQQLVTIEFIQPVNDHWQRGKISSLMCNNSLIGCGEHKENGITIDDIGVHTTCKYRSSSDGFTSWYPVETSLFRTPVENALTKAEE